jgi:hypothetical protein
MSLLNNEIIPVDTYAWHMMELGLMTASSIAIGAAVTYLTIRAALNLHEELKK